jgi:ribonuclease BN (tRNA processing enzyme)
VELHVLGASGTYPAAGAPGSGYLVRSARGAVWCDAGPGTFAALAAVLPPEAVDALVLSHVHPDHCSDLFALVHYLSYGPPAGGATVDVYVPDGAVERFAAFLGADPDHAMFRVLRFHEAAPGTGVDVADLRIEFAAARHSVPAIFTRFSCEGRTLVYSGDTGPSPILDEFAAGADVLLAEATLGPDDPPWVFHLSASQAGEIAARAGVGRLVLTHLRPTLDPGVAASLAAAAFGADPIVATPGLRLQI